MSYAGVGPVVVIDSIGEEPVANGDRKRVRSDPDDKTDSKKIRDHKSQELDELGDLTLRVGPEQSSFKVCSRTVSRVSPVFMRMLHGRFKESRPESSDWIVDLPDDDTESMQIMLNMMHARFDWVPQRISIPDLYEMLVLVDKYDALDVIQPWARGWVDSVGEDLDQPALLWIASELGDSELFGKVVMEIATKKMRKLSRCGYQERTSPVTLDFMRILKASELAEIINHARKELLMLELLPYWSVIQEIHTGGYTQRLIDPEMMDGEMCLEYANDHYDCGATLLSRLLNGFHRLDRQEQLPVGNGLQGSGFAHHYRKTVTALRDTLAKATFFEIEHPMAYEGTTCDGCAEWIEATLQKEQEARDRSKILSSIRSVSEDHQGYMAQRGVRTGLYVDKAEDKNYTRD
ncbi:nuclear pore protein-like protein [Colletotrichum chrysophilum]|uniref:Nuclear pore protein-like protein n=1 Tax=Colletotrichum chrysophilum TaxID=1836956 RepID=A0AAD9AD60_9PEZI|nr:nuclear pore protein-like protein [Colletotrichum chrysophilum]